MKYILVIVALFVLLWLLRGTLQRRRGAERPGRSEARRGSSRPEPMLACVECGMHLPRGEALPGRGGVFCGEAHRAAYERAHPAS